MKHYYSQKWKQILSWLAVCLWMTGIFFSSAQTADVSGGNSKGIVRTVIEAAEQIRLIPAGTSNNEELMSQWDHFLRKCTHFTVYLILALLLLHAFRRSGTQGRRRYIFSLVICVIYAATDEFHQLFVAGRGAQVRDVLIDSSGAAIGTILYWLRKRKTAEKR